MQKFQIKPTTSTKLYFLSAFFGLLAGNMFNYSLVIFAHSLSANESFASQVFFVAYIPFIFLSFRAGYYLDKFSRKLVMATSQLICFSSAFFPGLLVYLGLLDSNNKELLYIFALTNGIGMSFTMPGRFALLGDLVQPERLSKSTVVLNVLMLIGFSLAPIIAGSIRETFSYGTLLMITGSTYILSTALLLLIPIPHEKHHNHPHRKEALLESLRFVKSHPIVMQSLLTLLLGSLLVGPVQVLIPEFGKKVLSLTESERGLMMGVLGIGLLTGSIGSAILGKSLSRGQFVLFSISGSGIFIGLAGYSSVFLAVLPLLFLSGIFLGGMTSLLSSIIQESTPNTLRGRIMSFYSLIFLLTPAFSGLVYGVFTHYISIDMTIAYAGAVSLIVGGVAVVTLKELKEYR